MTPSVDNLKSLESHFQFGQNWAEYSELINEERIKTAIASVSKLLGPEGVKGKTFLDIGCGSGLFSLAAAFLGASKIVSIDIDPNSVATTQKILAKFAPQSHHYVKQVSIFDLSDYLLEHPELGQQFDIVYSWGVLHHTGHMFEALQQARKLLAPKGTFAIALYNKTLCCGLWTVEKKWFNKVPKFVQNLILGVYITFFAVARTVVKRESFYKYCKDYKAKRGMSFFYDVRDWIGGYPYESISPKDFANWASQQGLSLTRQYLCGGRIGIFAAGCNEFVMTADIIDAN